jgi:hypothetical protein
MIAPEAPAGKRNEEPETSSSPYHGEVEMEGSSMIPKSGYRFSEKIMPQQ